MLEPAVQPLLASASRAVVKLEDLGDPLPGDVRTQLGKLQGSSSPDSAIRSELKALLQPFVLVEAHVDEYGVFSGTPGAAPANLVQHGWRSFLIRITNPHCLQGSLVELTQGVFSLIDYASNAARIRMPDTLTVVPRIQDAWLAANVSPPTSLSGLEVEYKVVSLYSRDSGVKTGRPQLALERPLADLNVPASVLASNRLLQHESRPSAATLVFDCLPARDVRLNIREPDGRSCMAAVTVRDSLGRSYPSKAMRLAPDMFFQEHVYRATGEVVQLPAGQYQFSAKRGPEYREVRMDVAIGTDTDEVSMVLDQWVDPASHGYYSGDPHIHAGGCSHYSVPTEGVTPETMIRQVRGEGLWLGSVLNWAPSYYHQKQFFSGESISPPALLEHADMQQAQGMMWTPQPTDRDEESQLRYDVEVSGFPSSHSGHVILLGLTDQDYPGTTHLEDWPSWNLPIMRWGRSQNALVGYAHCGFGLSVGTDELPNYIIPTFQSIGSNEIIVDVPLGAADFQCGAQFAPAAELNIWYHLLNVGYRTLMLGETDYPCVYDDRPGVGRTYVRLAEPPQGQRALEAWTTGLRERASYFGDGRSHVFDFAVNGDVTRELPLDAPAPIHVSATVAAWLPEDVPTARLGRPLHSGPVGWDLERERIGESRAVLLELVVNGQCVASQEIHADGGKREVTFDVELVRSSWVALRILRSVHTQPIFLELAGKPIRASRRSAQWLHDSVDALWNAKAGFIRPSERAAAQEAYEAARTVYSARQEECEVDS